MQNNMEVLYSYVVGGSIVWGIVNVIKKKFLNEGIHEDRIAVLFALGCGISALLLEFAFNGINTLKTSVWTSAFLLPFAVTAVLNIFILYGTVLAMKYEDVSIVAPLSSSMPMFVIVMSYALLGEWPTFWGRIGILCIALGAYLLYLKGAKYPLPMWLQTITPEKRHDGIAFLLTPCLRLASSKGARYALGVAYLGAVAVNFDKLAVLATNPMIFSSLAFLFVASVIFLSSNVAGNWKNPNIVVFWKIFGLGLFMGIGSVMMNAGYLYGIVPYVGTLKRAQILWTVVLAWFFLGEKHGALRLVGAAIIFAGATLILF